jgi:hypothetical protein
MGFPKKWKHLIEKDPVVPMPDAAQLTYAVCACNRSSCGWGGWIIESLEKRGRKRRVRWEDRRFLPIADEDQRCPLCGNALFRTGVSVLMEKSRDQRPLKRWAAKWKRRTSPIRWDG